MKSPATQLYALPCHRVIIATKIIHLTWHHLPGPKFLPIYVKLTQSIVMNLSLRHTDAVTWLIMLSLRYAQLDIYRWQAITSEVVYDPHNDVIKWKHFPRYWPFVRGIHRSPVNSPHRGQWCGALMYYLICAWINGWVNNGEAGDLGRHSAHYNAHYDVTHYDIKLSNCTIIF